MPYQLKLSHLPWHLIIIFLLLTIGIGSSGYFYYKNQKEHIKKTAEEELSAIADLKVSQILNWRKERLGNATTVLRSPFVTSGIHRWLKNPSDSIFKQGILNWMASFRKNYDYESILLLDPKGTVLLSSPEGKALDCSYIQHQVAEALRTRNIVLTDLHRSEPSRMIHLGVVIPLLAPEGDRSSPISVLVLQVDPYQFLYPLIQSRPTPGRTSETLLIRREGNEVVYLNELRHQKNTALNLRLPLSKPHLPAAIVVQGKEGVVDGMDYRGIPVLAAMRSIPGSPWYLITKIDKEEVYSPIHERTRLMVILASLLIASAGVILGLLWSQQRAQFYKKQYETELKHQALVQRFDYLTKYANDIILLMDQDLKIVEANDRALSSYGYTRDELLQLNLRELRPPDLRLALEAQVKQLEQLNGLVYETFNQRKDGTKFPVEVSSRLIEVEGEKFYQSIIRDITKRKQAQEAFHESEQRYRNLIENAPDVIYTLAKNGTITSLNPAFERITGWPRSEWLGKQFASILHPDDLPLGMKFWQRILQGETPPTFELRVLTKSCNYVVGEFIATPQTQNGSVISVLGIARDITERKQAEEWLSKINRCFLSFGADPSENINRLTALCGEVMEATCALYNRLDGDMLCSVGKWNTPPDYNPMDKPEGHICYDVIQRGGEDIYIVHDLPHTKYSKTDPNVTSYKLQTYIGKAVKWQGAFVGSLCVVYQKDFVPNETNLKIMGIIASAISIEEERKQAEKAVQTSKKEWENTFNAMSDWISLLDLEARILHTNLAGEKFTGISPAEMVGPTCCKLAHGSEKPLPGCPFQKMLHTHHRESKELQSKDGDRWLMITVDPVMDEEGNLIGAVHIVRDITEWKQAEEALRESEKRYRQVIENAVEIIYATDVNGNFTYANTAALKAVDYSLEELQRLNYLDLVVPEHRERVTSIYADQFREKQSSTYVEFPFFNKSGEVMWFGQNASLVFEGKRFMGLHIIARDITDRKRAEEALKDSEERFRALFEQAAVGVAQVETKTGRFLRINQRYCDIVGYTIEEMQNLTFKEITHPEDLQVDLGNVKLLIEGKIKEFSMEKRYYHKNGTIVWVNLTLSPMWAIGGNPNFQIAVVQDITERKRAEQEMAALQEQLRQSQKMEAIGRLAGGIAHDFNNLLTVIKGYSQLSSVEIKEDGPLRENIEEIKKSADRAAGLTRQLLAFSRRQIMEMRVLDLNDLLRDLDRLLQRVIGEDIELVTILDRNLGRVKTDPGQIEQVIMNLAVNARDAMSKGGKLTIETANVDLDQAYARAHVAVTPGRYVMVSVTDAGVGMSLEVKDRIFEPFFTTKEKGKGTGLGLSTVYGIVKQSDGNIWVYSEPGKGTAFKIYLPRIDEPLEELKEKIVEAGPPRGSETILIVEDEKEVLTLAGKILKRQGYYVWEAASGEEALKVYKEKKEPFHLLLTDVVMPQMNGRQLEEQLGQLCRDFKVLYMSGYTDNAITHHGMLEKGVNYLQKPFTVDGLVRKVREVLDK